ncbi:carboxylesterase/lipase family protein [Corynebacterium heidelbergense]|uniref:Carboxylic ester hydrolase n=1 Tax=Corynebacterium heidelbergense TaxID=2055947 RepID=A0A364V7W3_9CORY|nr:carboxylesterase family protein [Corynebacterium heidelbergense]RAV32694.1 carboxylesterase/lipase family protein [Corynebacterium heidelbergense]
MNCAGQGCGDPLLVHTGAGAVRGVEVDGIRTWRGVPYGAAGRWERPHRVEWEGEWPAEEYGPVAPQTTYSLKDEVIGQESCLNLDVVRPADDRQLPVVVYLHGGGFFSGASHTAVLRGFGLARELGVVYVAVNFRLGALGYVDMSALGSVHGGFSQLDANPALRDQIRALKWVRDHIHAFGGDPNRVCVMGESAGGAAVAALMAAPAARGLFHRAIIQSAPVMAAHSPEQSRLWARRLVQYSGFTPRTVRPRDMTGLPAADVIRAGQQMLWRGRGLRELNPCFGHAVDGVTLPSHPLRLFSEGAQAPVPLLIGTNSDELSAAQVLFVSRRERARVARTALRLHDPEGADAVERAYGDVGRRDAFARMLADAIFWAQSVRLAELHTAVAPTWMYRFDYAPQALRRLGVGAMHAMELAALFGDARASKARMLLGAEMDAVTHHMQAAWGAFVWGKDPGWLRYTRTTRATRILEVHPRTEFDPRSEYRRAWEHFRMEGWTGTAESVALPRPGR